MKTNMTRVTGDLIILFVLLVIFLIGKNCQAQAMGGSSIQAPYTNSVVMPDHVQHASQMPLATEQNLYGTNGVYEAHGTRPLWEFASPNPKIERPLGDVSREYRSDHFAAEKARVVWNGNKDGVIRLHYE